MKLNKVIKMGFVMALLLMSFYSQSQNIISENLIERPALNADETKSLFKVDFYPNGFIRSCTDLGTPYEIRHFEKNSQKKEIGINISGINNDTIILDEIDTTINCFIEITEGGVPTESFAVLLYEFVSYFNDDQGVSLRGIRSIVPSNEFYFLKPMNLKKDDWWYFEIRNILIYDYENHLIYYLPIRREYSFWDG